MIAFASSIPESDSAGVCYGRVFILSCRQHFLTCHPRQQNVFFLGPELVSFCFTNPNCNYCFGESGTVYKNNKEEFHFFTPIFPSFIAYFSLGMSILGKKPESASSQQNQKALAEQLPLPGMFIYSLKGFMWQCIVSSASEDELQMCV